MGSNKESIKHKYHKKTHYLEDGALVIHVSDYVKNPDALFNELLTSIPWTRFTYRVYDKDVLSPRLMQIVEMKDVVELPHLKEIKERLEKVCKVKFKYAVLNYYRDGNDHISYHSDREVEHGKMVASVSLGQTRRFVLRHKGNKNKVVFEPKHGDVLILNDAAINFVYKHRVPKMKNAKARINITFRQ